MNDVIYLKCQFRSIIKSDEGVLTPKTFWKNNYIIETINK